MFSSGKRGGWRDWVAEGQTGQDLLEMHFRRDLGLSAPGLWSCWLLTLGLRDPEGQELDWLWASGLRRDPVLGPRACGMWWSL